MNRLEMREQTRRAVSDVCGIILANYGIVPTFQQVTDMAIAIDREMLRFGSCVVPATPDQWSEMKAETVKEIRG